MTNGLTGRRSAMKTATRAGLLAIGLVLAAGLSACTTVEGTNALTDFATFEREVVNTTAAGIGLIPEGAAKPDPTPRAPLALPRDLATLPAPSQGAAAQLPENSNTPQIDVSSISEADLMRLRDARVVDLHTLSGRPLTDDEVRMLTARMTAAGMNVSAAGQRPLYLPPEHYFTVVGGRDYVCRTPAGDLVPLSDPRCPAEIRQAIASARPAISGSSEPFVPGGGR